MKEKVSVIVFDFDGVIVDSEREKRKAWYTLLKESKDPKGFSWASYDHDALIKEAHRAWVDGTSKGSRYEIIEHMIDAVQYPKSKEMIDWYAGEYDKKVQEAVLAAGVSKETMKVLEILSARVPLYVNSATPEEALRRSVERLGIRKFFIDVFGKTPENRDESKTKNIHIAATQENVPVEQVLFVGDAVSDFRAAEKAGSQFIRFTGFDNAPWEKEAPKKINSLSELFFLLKG